MSFVIFANGRAEHPESLKRWIKDGDRILCADGGARLCLELGLVPELVVGDFDSLGPQELERCLELGATLERHPRDKDSTDLELAVARAADLGARQALILGGWGDEPDHVLGNVMLLAAPKPRLELAMAHGDMLFQVLRAGGEQVLQGPVGGLVSVLALSAQVTGLSYQGLAFPLNNALLDQGSCRALRNRISRSPARIRIASGLLLIMHQAW